jgi:hypothetical protein
LARHALVAITTNGSPLPGQKLAAAMKEHVDGMLGQLHEVDAVPDHVQEEDTDTV